LQQRQGKRQGFAGAGLRRTQHVASGQRWPDGQLLNGCGLGVAEVRDSGNERRRESLIGKGHGGMG